MTLSDTEIQSVESAVAAFDPNANIQSGVRQLERACQQYSKVLRAQNPDAGKVQLAALERSNPAAYAKVLATVPVGRQAEMTAFVSQFKGQPLAGKIKIQSVSVSRGIAASPPVLKG